MKQLRFIFLASFLFTFHLALLSYLNSTVLALHAGAFGITLTYTISSALSLLLVVIAPNIVRTIGASKFLIGSLSLSTIILWLLGIITSVGFVTAFIVYFSLNTVIWYAFDLVIEHYSRESITGNIRGAYLALNNAGWVLAPITASIIVSHVGFNATYLIGSILMLLSLVVIALTKKIHVHTHIPRISLSEAFKSLVRHEQARRIVSLYFILQFFFAWMVIYMVPYLTGLGFTLKTIGLILSVMLLPFLIFQYPAGIIADKFHGEKKMIIFGFAIAGIATAFLALPLPPQALYFALILFATRIGASIIEVGCESMFFKEVTEKDTALISTLRMTLPLAYIIAPLLGAIVLSITSVPNLFLLLSISMFGAVLYSFRLTNQK